MTGAEIAVGTFILGFLGSSYHGLGKHTEMDLVAGMSFAHHTDSAVLGTNLRWGLTPKLDLFAGTDMWMPSQAAALNWDWHGGVRSCYDFNVCLSLGASYLQKIDAINGAHAEYFLSITYKFGSGRISDVGFMHLSDAGTSIPNIGRNAAIAEIRLQ